MKALAYILNITGSNGLQNHFAARGRDLVCLVCLVYLVCLVQRTRETRETLAPDRRLSIFPGAWRSGAFFASHLRRSCGSPLAAPPNHSALNIPTPTRITQRWTKVT